jgi:metallo-beta-lactamase class B
MVHVINCARTAGCFRILNMRILLRFLLMLTSGSAATAQTDQTIRSWNQPVAPFRIAGNLYYVGAAEVTSFLITTPEGHFLLDGGFVETAPQIERNIAQLGFNLGDIKYLLNSHAHFDHAGGLAELKKHTGATFVATGPDAPLLKHGGHGDFRFGDTLTFPPVTPNRIIADGESVEIGGQKMTAHLTPGHTKGNTTWTTKIVDGGKQYDVVFAGSPTALDYQLFGRESYPGIAADFERTFAVLKQLPCDIFLSCHGSFFSLTEKRERFLRGQSENPFIDPAGYRAFIAQYEKELRDKLDQQKWQAAASP